MASEIVELALKFSTQGQADIERISSQLDQVTTKAQRSSAALDGVNSNLGRVGQSASGLNRIMEMALPVAGAVAFGAALAGVVETVGQLYNEWSPVIRAQKEALQIVTDLERAFARISKDQERVLYRRVETREGRSGLLRFQAKEAEDEARYFNQAEINRVRGLIGGAEQRVHQGTGPGGLTQDARAAQALLIGLNAQLEKAVAQQSLSLEKAKEFRAEAAKLELEDRQRFVDRFARQQGEIERILNRYRFKGADGIVAYNNELFRNVDAIRKRGATGDQIRSLLSDQSGEGTFLLNQDLSRYQANRRIDSALNFARRDFGFDFIAKTEDSKGQREQIEAFAQGLVDSEQKRQELAKQTISTQVNGFARLLELMGSEYTAAKLVYDLKRSQAETTIDAAQAELEYNVRITEIDKRRLDSYKQTAGQVYRSLRQGGSGGLQTFLTGQFDIQGQKLFENVSGKIFQSAGGTFANIGKSLGLPGWLTEGTIFDQANTPLDKNTSSMTELTRTIKALEKTLRGGGLVDPFRDLPYRGAGGEAFDMLRVFGSDVNGITGSKVFGKIFGNSAKRSTNDFLSGLATLGTGNTLRTAFGPGRRIIGYDEMGQPQFAGTSGAERAGAIVGAAGTITAGGFGVYSGIKQGGAKGTLNAVASGAATAAALDPEPISKTILAAIALVSSLAGTFLPNPKESFDRRQTDLLNSRRFTGPDALNQTYDYSTGGNTVDYDFRGKPRVIVQQTINFAPQMLDMASLERRGPDMAKVVGRLMIGGQTPEIKQAIDRMVWGT